MFKLFNQKLTRKGPSENKEKAVVKKKKIVSLSLTWKKLEISWLSKH